MISQFLVMWLVCGLIFTVSLFTMPMANETILADLPKDLSEKDRNLLIFLVQAISIVVWPALLIKMVMENNK